MKTSLLHFLDLDGEFNICSVCFPSFAPCTASFHNAVQGRGYLLRSYLYKTMFDYFLPSFEHGKEKIPNFIFKLKSLST